MTSVGRLSLELRVHVVATGAVLVARYAFGCRQVTASADSSTVGAASAETMMLSGILERAWPSPASHTLLR